MDNEFKQAVGHHIKDLSEENKATIRKFLDADTKEKRDELFPELFPKDTKHRDFLLHETTAYRIDFRIFPSGRSRREVTEYTNDTPLVSTGGG